MNNQYNMKFEITQTITQTITRVVDAKDKQHALAFIEDEKFREDLEVQRMEQWETEEEWDVTPIEEESNAYTLVGRLVEINSKDINK